MDEFKAELTRILGGLRFYLLSDSSTNYDIQLMYKDVTIIVRILTNCIYFSTLFVSDCKFYGGYACVKYKINEIKNVSSMNEIYESLFNDFENEMVYFKRCEKIEKIQLLQISSELKKLFDISLIGNDIRVTNNGKYVCNCKMQYYPRDDAWEAKITAYSNDNYNTNTVPYNELVSKMDNIIGYIIKNMKQE